MKKISFTSILLLTVSSFSFSENCYAQSSSSNEPITCSDGQNPGSSVYQEECNNN